MGGRTLSAAKHHAAPPLQSAAADVIVMACVTNSRRETPSHAQMRLLMPAGIANNRLPCNPGVPQSPPFPLYTRKDMHFDQGSENNMKYLIPLFLGILCATDAPAAESHIIAPGATLQKLASEFEFTEGPACDSKGNVYFTDQPNDRIMKWSVDGKLTTFMKPCGRSNGLSFDGQDNLWACADEKNELWRIDRAGKPTVIVKDYQGKLLNGPNDVWIRPSGGLYFTDPYYQRPYWKRGPKEMDECVYYLAPDNKTLTRVVDDMKQPNGIIGTPDGKLLYVSDIGAGKTYRYGIQPNGALTERKLFCELGSDGMTIDHQGNIYLTGKGVTVFNPAGEKIEHVDVQEPWTANVCFGGKDRKTLFITASKSLYAMQMAVHGVDSQ
jgi:gluconolactonase